MARPRYRDVKVRLTESAGSDHAGVARAIYSWAILLADQASHILVTEASGPSSQKIPPASP